MSAAEIRTEIARLVGLLCHECGADHAIMVLFRIAGALKPGARQS